MQTLFEMEPLEESGLKLNDAQRRAITHGEGPLLVIAGAGTGKTRVITERIRQLFDLNPDLTGENSLARTFTKKAARGKKRVSLGSLIPSAVALLETDAALRESLQQRFRYILVDEFQDTNIAQMRLLELLAGELRNIFAVGDNDQAIYRFRGASFAIFQLFLQKFAGWKAGDDSHKFRVSLTENYRSTPNILRVATQVIGQ